MKTKRMAFALVIVLLVSMTVQAATNPFSDVPADHWAYDSVIELAAVGLVEGYPDGTYGGTRTVTRYESAMVWARMLARLEALVEVEMAENTEGIKKDITNDVMAEIYKAKGDLASMVVNEVGKAMAVSDQQATIVEPSDRDFVLTPEAEAVIADLVADLAADYLAEAVELAKKTVQETAVVERVVVEAGEVDEAVINAIVEEVLAASLVEVTSRVDALERQVTSDKNYVTMITGRINDRLGRVTQNVDTILANQAETAADFELVNGLIAGIQGDVAALQAALNDKTSGVSSQVAAVSKEFTDELALLGVRIDELDMLYANLDGRVTELETKVVEVDTKLEAHEADYAAFKAETERVKVSGSLDVDTGYTLITDGTDPVAGEAKGIFDKYTVEGLEYKTDTNLTLTAQIAEGTTLNLKLGGGGGNYADALSHLSNHQVEIVSDSMLSRLVVGKLDDSATEKDIAKRFNSYVVKDGRDRGALADVSLGNFDFNLLASKDSSDNVAAVGTRLAFWPALGLSLTGAATIDGNAQLDQAAVGAGLFGEIAGVNYDLTVAYDRYEKELADNLLVDVAVGASLGVLNVDANYTMVGENFANGQSKLTDDGVFLDDTKTRIGLDAGATLFGVDLAAGTYMEKDDAGTNSIQTTMVEADYGFDLFLPFELSARYARNVQEENHYQVGVGVSGINLFGINAGAGYTLVNNYIDGDWRNPSKWTGQDAHIVDVAVGYAADLNNAALDLGYDFEMLIPRNDTATDFGNEMSHKVSADYGFSDDLTLSLTAKRVNMDNKAVGARTISEVTAGVEFAF